MNFIELATARYSERNYSNKPIAAEDLDYILSCARMAPSAVNKQPWHIYVVQGDTLQKMGDVYRREAFRKAPMCLVITGNHQESWHRSDGKDHCDIDIAIVSDHIILAAAELGINTCWVCNFDVPLCTELLQLPAHEEPIVLIPMGYAAEETAVVKKRKDLEQIVTYLP